MLWTLGVNIFPLFSPSFFPFFPPQPQGGGVYLETPTYIRTFLWGICFTLPDSLSRLRVALDIRPKFWLDVWGAYRGL